MAETVKSSNASLCPFAALISADENHMTSTTSFFPKAAKAVSICSIRLL